MLTAALAGDAAAWRRLVRRYEPMLRSIGRQYRLAPADIDDAMQTTWLRLFRVLHAIRTPDALGGWLATTMRRECWQILQAPTREVLVAEAPAGESRASAGRARRGCSPPSAATRCGRRSPPSRSATAS